MVALRLVVIRSQMSDMHMRKTQRQLADSTGWRKYLLSCLSCAVVLFSFAPSTYFLLRVGGRKGWVLFGVGLSPLYRCLYAAHWPLKDLVLLKVLTSGSMHAFDALHRHGVSS